MALEGFEAAGLAGPLVARSFDQHGQGPFARDPTSTTPVEVSRYQQRASRKLAS